MRNITTPPKASSLIESLRDIGYSLKSAVADIIDNSITANASEVNLHFEWDKEKSNIAIIDNGNGMTHGELLEAMRPGSMSPLDHRDRKDLGRFGLGLKTASFSQCRKLTVITKTDGTLAGCCWDVDYVVAEGEWLLKILDSSEIKEISYIDMLSDSGTMVLWERLDRVIDATDKIKTETNLYSKMDIVRKHLELVFHRYLKGEPGINSLSIKINGHRLNPFDPFHSRHSATQHLQDEKLILCGETIYIQPYILPHHSKTSAEDYEYYAGDGGYLKNQGFYVYRNSRLLISGTWFRLAKQRELTKLARVRIDLPNNLDHLWLIDVKKSKANPPEIIRQRLKCIIDKITGSSSRVYTTRGRRLTQKGLNTVWYRKAKHNEIFYTVNKNHPLIENFVSNLDDDQSDLFMDILSLIEGQFPIETLYSDLSNNPELLGNRNVEKDKLLKLAGQFYRVFHNQGMDRSEILEQFKYTPPFSNYPELIKEFMDSMEVENERP